MAEKWYQSRAIQASTIGGLAVVTAAVVTVVFSARSAPPLPPLEIRTVSQGSEHVLSRLALKPDRQLIDSLAFGQLKPEFIVLSDSFGIAIREPEDYTWSAGVYANVDELDPGDIPFFAYRIERFRSAFQFDTLPDLAEYGVRRDQLINVRLTRRSAIADIPLDENPFRRQEYADAHIELVWEAEVADFTARERRLLRGRWSAQVDSIIDEKTPVEKTLHTGVFITPVTVKRLRAFDVLSAWSNLDPFEIVLLSEASGVPAPRFFFVDGESGVGVFNRSLRLRNVEIDGVNHEDVIYNRAGYVVRSRDVIFVVSIRYLSTEGEQVIRELERFFESVRLRAPSVARSR